MIRLEDVHLHYGSIDALKGVSFGIRRGEILGLLGHNGAGKTTSMRLICGLLAPSSGRIEIDDPAIPITPDRREFKARLGYCPEEPFHFPYLSGREMLHFLGCLYGKPPSYLAPRISSLLERFDLRSSADRLIHSYSRGMKRKLSILGSMLHEPDYWILDEPTESLDPVAIRTLKDMSREFRDARRAVVISTHQLALAESLCDRLVILHQGSVIFDGTMETLRHASFSEFSSLEDIYVSLFGSLTKSV